MTEQTSAAFALSADEEKEFALMAGGEPAPEQDFEDIAERDPDAAADIAGAEADESGEDEQWKKDRKVPFKVFDAERNRARRAETERQSLAQEYATARERLNMLMAVVEGRKDGPAPAPQVPAAPQVPDWQKLKQGAQEDIFTSVEGTIDRVQMLEQQLQQTQQEVQQRAWRQQVEVTHTQAENAVRAQVEDYDDAVNHLKLARAQQLQILGWQPQDIVKQVQQESFDFVAQQLRAGQNPAVAAYRYALAMGYTPKQARAQAQAAEGETMVPRDEQGRFVAQRDPKLDAVAASQQRNKSLTNAGGGASPRQSAFERVMAMDDKAFKKFVDKGVDRDEWFRIMNS